MFRGETVNKTDSYCDKYLNISLEKLKKVIIDRYPDRQPICFLHSFGCQQNVSDGEKIMGMLELAGFAFTSCREEADLIIYNTCAVRENAEDKVFGVIGDLKHLKEQKPETIIAVCGCMAQQDKTVERIKSTYKQVDIVFGTYAYKELFDMLLRL